MTNTLIIGLVFLSILLIFLMVTFFVKPDLTKSQHNTLHFITSLCGGFAGGFLTGDALIKIDATMSNGLKIGISGTAGFAIFFLIWFTYQKFENPKPNDAFYLSIPSNWSFEHTCNSIAQSKNGLASFSNFSEDELKLTLNEATLNEKSAVVAIKKLKELNSSIPPYSVTFDNNQFLIKKTN